MPDLAKIPNGGGNDCWQQFGEKTVCTISVINYLVRPYRIIAVVTNSVTSKDK